MIINMVGEKKVKMNRSYVSDGVFTKYEKESGKLRLSGGSWTINVDKINLDEVDKIVYITMDHIYEIDKNHAVSSGYFRNFRGENKLVVPLTKWEKKKNEW